MGLAAGSPGVVPPPPPRGVSALLALGLLLRLGLVASGACDSAVVADDAYYYLTIARNLAHGLGATFDGIAPTNGFHPLWQVMLVPVAALTTGPGTDPWIFVRLALGLCAALDAVAGLLMFRLLALAGHARAGRWALALWLLAPPAVLTTLRGTEASLSAALVAGWLLLAARAVTRSTWTAREGAALGALSGLAALARTDNVPFLGAAAVAIGLWAWTRRRPPPRAALACLGAAAGVAALVCLPWLAWSLATFGTPWQVSGAVKALHRGIYGELPAGRVESVAHLFACLAVPAKFAAGEEFARLRWTLGYAWMALFALLLAVPGWRRSLAAPRHPALAVLVLGGGVYLAAHAVAYALVLRSYVTWYAAVPLLLLAALVGGLGVGTLLEGAGRKARAIVALVALLVAAAGYARFVEATGFHPRAARARLAPAFRRLARDFPTARTIGAYNAGRPGYFAPSFGPWRIVNLDGLVNNALVAAWREGRYVDWVTRHVDALYLDEMNDLGIWMTPREIAALHRMYPYTGTRRLFGPRRPDPLARPDAALP